MNGYLRSYVNIDLDAIAHNINEVKKRVTKGTKILAVIKTDAYGHGAVAVARRLYDMVDFFAVATIDEAIELRENDIKTPILILGYTSVREAEYLVQYDISQTVYSYELAQAMSAAAVKYKKIAKLHIAVDTGMTRIGFDCNEESIRTVVNISRLEGVVIEGMFTHFSCADMYDKNMSYEQMDKFDNFVNSVKNEGVNIEIVHMCNSAGVMEFEDHRYDMVRSGIVTYGLWPSDEVDKTRLKLIPALSWKAHIVNLHRVKAGTKVSYGATFVTDKITDIATVSVGYGDGYPRSLSSKGKVIINGKYASVIGRVCMDQIMVDVTGIEGLNIEDEVTLLGSDGDLTITAEDIGNMSGRFNYELVCDINKRVTRIYNNLEN